MMSRALLTMTAVLLSVAMAQAATIDFETLGHAEIASYVRS